SQLIQNREVIGVGDRYQVAWDMPLRPVGMIIAAARDHGWQLAGAAWSLCDTGRPKRANLLPGAWQRSPSAFTHPPSFATNSRPANGRSSSGSTIEEKSDALEKLAVCFKCDTKSQESSRKERPANED